MGARLAAGPQLSLMRTRILISLTVLLAAAAGALFGGAFRESSSAASAALAGAQSAEDFKAGFSLNASTASLVADIQSRLQDRKSTRLNSSHIQKSRMPSSA